MIRTMAYQKVSGWPSPIVEDTATLNNSARDQAAWRVRLPSGRNLSAQAITNQRAIPGIFSRKLLFLQCRRLSTAATVPVAAQGLQPSETTPISVDTHLIGLPAMVTEITMTIATASVIPMAMAMARRRNGQI